MADTQRAGRDGAGSPERPDRSAPPDDGEHDDAEEVEPFAHACHAAAEPERERPREVEDE